MSRLLVTGANGLIGSRLLDRLSGSDWDLWSCSRSGSSRKQHIQADLRVPHEVEQLLRVEPDALIHLAGARSGTVRDLFSINVWGTANLLSGLSVGTRAIVVGSAAEYGDPGYSPVSEDGCLRPVSTYGWSKLAQTITAESIAKANDLGLAVIRPFNLYGPAMHRGSALHNLATQVKEVAGHGGRDISAGRLDVVRDFVSVDLVAEQLINVLNDPDPPSAMNVCSGEGIRLDQILDALSTMLGVLPRVVIDPSLAAIPAPDRVVGDPTLMEERYGKRDRPTPGDIAATLLREDH